MKIRFFVFILSAVLVVGFSSNIEAMEVTIERILFVEQQNKENTEGLLRETKIAIENYHIKTEKLRKEYESREICKGIIAFSIFLLPPIVNHFCPYYNFPLFMSGNGSLFYCFGKLDETSKKANVTKKTEKEKLSSKISDTVFSVLEKTPNNKKEENIKLLKNISKLSSSGKTQKLKIVLENIKIKTE